MILRVISECQPSGGEFQTNLLAEKTTGTNSSEINRNRLVVLRLPAGFSVPKSKVLHIIHYPDETLPDTDMKK